MKTPRLRGEGSLIKAKKIRVFIMKTSSGGRMIRAGIIWK
jgi:hypothetical protein